MNKCFVSVAQHHGKSLGERRKTGWSCGEVRAPGKPVQSLLQDCKYRRVVLLTLDWISDGHSLTACMCVHVKPVGTETELMLRNHVMPLPRPRGHASLCLSAFPTTPIMHLPPAVNTKDRMDASTPGWGAGIRARKGGRVVARRNVTSPDCGWWGAERVIGFWSGEEVTFELFLTSQRVNIYVVFEYQSRT